MDLSRLPDDELLARTPERPEAFGTFYARHERAVVAWLHGIARHTLARSAKRRRVEDRARRRLGMPPLELTDELLERVDRIGADDRAAALLERLSPDQAHAVRAHVIEEVPYERLAAELQCSASVVRKRVSRG